MAFEVVLLQKTVLRHSKDDVTRVAQNFQHRLLSPLFSCNFVMVRYYGDTNHLRCLQVNTE